MDWLARLRQDNHAQRPAADSPFALTANVSLEPNMSIKPLISITAGLLFFCSSAGAQSWNAEQQQLIDINQDIPLKLKRDGFAAYSAQFHPDYTNWYMSNPKPKPREEFLGSVKQWFGQGNYATASQLTPISIQIEGETAYMRFVQKEDFIDAKGKKSSFTGLFASLMKKSDGKWLFYATSFIEAPPQADAAASS